MKIILTNKPQYILEISSGVSSLVIGYTLKLNGGGKCISIENNEKIAQQLKKSVEACGLKDFVDIRYAPLKTYIINDTEYLWYNISEIDDVLNIDLMIVDGPYKGIQQYARLPAAYLMDSRMSEHCSIIMDDMNRDEEKEIVWMWEKDLDLKVEEYYECEKGACSLIKVKK